MKLVEIVIEESSRISNDWEGHSPWMKSSMTPIEMEFTPVGNEDEPTKGIHRVVPEVLVVGNLAVGPEVHHDDHICGRLEETESCVKHFSVDMNAGFILINLVVLLRPNLFPKDSISNHMPTTAEYKHNTKVVGDNCNWGPKVIPFHWKKEVICKESNTEIHSMIEVASN